MVFSLGETRNRPVYKRTISCSLSTLARLIQSFATNILLQTITNKLALEAELPDDKQDVVKELETNTAG